MIRRDVISQDNRDRFLESGIPERSDRSGTDMHIELDPADHDEPTWEVHRPGERRKRRLDGRTRRILIFAAAAALAVNAGAAWTYWHITGSETRQVGGQGSVELALRARSDLNRPLRPGETGNLTVTVTNDNVFPIRITTVTPGAGNVVADEEHRDAGCRVSQVSLIKHSFDVTWDVPRNTIGAFTIPGALSMRPNAKSACLGAVFTVPLTATGRSRDPF